jgi:hypothetical protein
MPVNATQISGDSTAADNLETAYDDTAGAVRWAGVIDQGTAQSATGTTLVLRSAAAFADDELIGATVVITGGTTGVGQARLITDYVSATDTATVDTWTTTPTGTITYRIYPTAPSSGSGSGPTAAQIADAVWDEATTGHTTSGTFGEQLKTDVDAILADTNELQTDWVDGGRLDLILDSRASQSSVNTIDDFLDTEMAAVLAAVDTEVATIVTQTGAAAIRTAVGLANNGRRLLLVVIDGRQAGYSLGTTLRETAEIMLALGARDAINLDGGGSSALVYRDSTRTMRVANKPSDAGGERAVGDALAIVRGCGRR